MKKRIFCAVMALLCAVLFSGCGKKTYTSSELMEMYGSEYGAEVWLYGTDEAAFLWHMEYYNAHAEKDIKAVTYSERDMTLEQFQKKLQGAVMSGKGPDLILTGNRNLFEDVEKVAAAGALSSFDEMIAGWEKEQYYDQMIEGVRSKDGHVYILPLAVDPDVIVTTEENLGRYGLTEADFSDFVQLTDTVTSLWQTQDDAGVLLNQPDFFRSIPALADRASGKSALTEEQPRALLAEWSEIMEVRNAWIRNSSGLTLEDASDELISGALILDTVPLSNVIIMAALTEQREKLFVLPAKDMEGRMSGVITSYALFPYRKERNSTAEDFMNMLLFDKKYGFANPCVSKESTYTYLCSITRTGQEDGPRNPILSPDMIDRLFAEPMRLQCYHAQQEQFEKRLRNCILSGIEADWGDLETDINIYLSE